MASWVFTSHVKCMDISYVFCKKPVEEYDHKLSEKIWNYFEVYYQGFFTLEKKIDIRDKLAVVLKKYFNETTNGYQFVDLFISGSTLNGFAVESSDLDLCFMVTDNYVSEFVKQKKLKILQDIQQILHSYGFEAEESQVIEARVPILRYIDKRTKIQVEINVNNLFGIQNTRLLYCYSKMDWRVSPLCVAIKSWAKYYGIIDSFNGYLSSYAIELMVIFYLQICRPVIIPCLQETHKQLFDSNQDITGYKKLPNIAELVGDYKSEDKRSLSRLFCGFFNFYLNSFDFTRHVASVRTAKALIKHKYIEKRYMKDPNQWGFICIEEPFSGTNVGRSVYELQAYNKIVDGFRKMDAKCREMMTIVCICDN